MGRASFKEKEIYIDPSGRIFYSIGEEGRVRNQEGFIKIDDYDAFKRETIKIANPESLLEFLVSELDESYLN